MTNPSPTAAVVSYDAFADSYDAFTHHHDYELWTTRLEELARRHGLSGRRLLDVGCGTGKSFAPFLERGYEVTACDPSEGMLREAARKSPGAVDLHVADARRLPRLGSFDLVLSLGDVLNYLLSGDEVRAALEGFARNLAGDGVCVFDANTLKTYRTFFAETICSDAEDRFFAWRGLTSPVCEPGVTAESRLEIFGTDDGVTWRRRTSRHLQRHHTDAEIRAYLTAAGLTCLGVYGQNPDGRVDDSVDDLRHTKRVYVAGRDGTNPTQERR